MKKFDPVVFEIEFYMALAKHMKALEYQARRLHEIIELTIKKEKDDE